LKENSLIVVLKIASSFVYLIKYFQGDQITEDEMGVECSTHWRDEQLTEMFGQKA
jgi:hypothetical protein